MAYDSAAPTENKLFISPKAQDNILQYMLNCYRLTNQNLDNRARFEEIDKSYLRENDKTAENQKAMLANKAGNIEKLRNIEVPMVMEATENSVSFLSQVFLSNYPIFKFGAPDKNQEKLAKQWNTIVGEDGIDFGWNAQFNVAFRNGEKYNFSPISVEWCEEKSFKIANGNGQNGSNVESIILAGQKIKSHDPYNTIYDPRVAPYRVQTGGEFIGYVENITRMELKIYLANLGKLRFHNTTAAFESSPWDIQVYYPQVNVSLQSARTNDPNNFNWDAWVNNISTTTKIAYKGMYTRTTIFAWIIPEEMGIQGPLGGTPTIFKLVAINNVLVYAEPAIAPYGFLPMGIVVPFIDNLPYQTKTSAENQAPFQAMVSALWNADLSLVRRAAMDRMIYNPMLIDPDHINSPNPTAKIPLRPTAYGRKLEEAVYKIPFEAHASGLYLQAAQGIAEWGMRAAGQNRTSIGQYQKGNKLQSEFETTMANAGARERTKAIMWEVGGMHPIKIILKTNYLIYTPKGDRYNRKAEENVPIDPTELRKAAGDFLVGDGMLPIEKLLHADIAGEALRFMSQSGEMTKKYDVAGMFVHIMELQGAEGLDQFERPPEQVAYEGALSNWTAAAMELAKSKPAVTTEELQKTIELIIGKKPEPPQTQEQKMQAAQNPQQPPQ